VLSLETFLIPLVGLLHPEGRFSPLRFVRRTKDEIQSFEAQLIESTNFERVWILYRPPHLHPVRDQSRLIFRHFV